MAEKKKAQEEEHGESAPLWIISFADLVTLMLSFFVILAAGNNGGSSTKNDPEFAKIVAALRLAFRDSSPADQAVLDAAAGYEDLIRKIQDLAKKKAHAKNRGDSDQEGLYGNSFRVRRLRDGMEITMGGPVFFDAFSGKLNEQGTQDVRQLAELLNEPLGHRAGLAVSDDATVYFDHRGNLRPGTRQKALIRVVDVKLGE